MLMGLGSMLKPGELEKKFALPIITTAGGHAYKPAPPPPVAGAPPAQQPAAVRFSAEEIAERDTSVGYVLSLAAALAGLNEQPDTAATFWREAAKDMREVKSVRKEEWAAWADKQAGLNDAAQAAKIKHGEKFPPLPDPKVTKPHRLLPRIGRPPLVRITNTHMS
jgi:hypothetical protein